MRYFRITQISVGPILSVNYFRKILQLSCLTWFSIRLYDKRKTCIISRSIKPANEKANLPLLVRIVYNKHKAKNPSPSCFEQSNDFSMLFTNILEKKQRKHINHVSSLVRTAAYAYLGDGHFILPLKCLIERNLLLFSRFHGTGLFYRPWKHQKTSGFLIFTGGIKRDQWHEMG